MAPEYIEVDGQMVPNYVDATIPIFGEEMWSPGGSASTRTSVLVDIGYKSEGVIPLSELSIRKSVNVEEEVSSAR
ncbi:MAG: hypothetical protein U0Y82_08865 [Thermoleophilia bacterium]